MRVSLYLGMALSLSGVQLSGCEHAGQPASKPATTALSSAPPPTEASAGAYDGNWSIINRSPSARCGKGIPQNMVIRNGQVSGTFRGNAGKYVASGTVAKTGELVFTLDSGVVDFTGNIDGDQGSGTFVGSGCRGTFNMTRV